MKLKIKKNRVELLIKLLENVDRFAGEFSAMDYDELYFTKYDLIKQLKDKEIRDYF